MHRTIPVIVFGAGVITGFVATIKVERNIISFYHTEPELRQVFARIKNRQAAARAALRGEEQATILRQKSKITHPSSGMSLSGYDC